MHVHAAAKLSASARFRGTFTVVGSVPFATVYHLRRSFGFVAKKPISEKTQPIRFPDGWLTDTT